MNKLFALLPLALAWPSLALAQDATYAAKGLAPQGPGPSMIAFWLLAVLTLLGAVATVSRRNPVTAAVCLIWTLAGTAGLYLLLHATFVAVMQVLVYAGAIMVLFIFVVMAVEKPEDQQYKLGLTWPTRLVGIAAIGALVFRVVQVVTHPSLAKDTAVANDFGSVSHVGGALFSDLVFPFEALSILLLVAIVGAVVISRRPGSEPAAPETAEQPEAH